MLTNLDFLQSGKPWPPPEEAERLNRCSQNRLLFEGKHERVFAQWVKLLRNDQQATLEMVLNWHKRLSTLWADLLLGEPPRITAGDRNSAEQQTAERIISSNQLHNAAYEVALDVSRYGVGLFKIRYDKMAIIEPQQPAMWFPVVATDNIRNIMAHILAYTYEVEEVGYFGKRHKQQYLKTEVHEKGKITTAVYLLKDGRIAAVREQEEIRTGVDDFLVVPVHNILTSDRAIGTDDYSDLDSIIQELEIRTAQISRILDKHADPNMYGPDTALEQDASGAWSFRGGGKYFPVGRDDSPPGYVTWDGQLEAAFKQIDLLMEQLYILSETSSAAFGQLKAGIAESGTALRRLMLAPLAKVNRLRLRFDPALKKVLKLAAALEVAQGMRGAAKLETIDIAWQDGLPTDDKEQAEIMSMLVQNGLISRETALKRLFQFEADTLKEELLRITAETNAEVPLIFRPNLQGQGGEQGGGGS